MTGAEIAERVSGALESHHMSVESDIYYFLSQMGAVIDRFNSSDGEIIEAREDLETLSKEVEEWLGELE